MNAENSVTDSILLRVRGLCVAFPASSDRGAPRADVEVEVVRDVSFDVPRGRTVGLVGESGCGKSMTAFSVLGLLPPTARVAAGEILFQDRDLLSLDERSLRSVRGAEIAMVFQEPQSSLNPVYTVGSQIAEAVRIHRRIDRRAARKRAIELLDRVRIPDARSRVDSFPHELSGGMQQRVMIAMALACDPKLLIADEPTTALDVTVEAQILDLLRELQRELDMSILLITHDLGVVAEIADEVLVMYAARIVERAPVRRLFAQPGHPYTRGLLASMPRVDEPTSNLHVIRGSVPDPGAMPDGCRFHPRCDHAIDSCRTREPPLVELAPGHEARCDVV